VLLTLLALVVGVGLLAYAADQFVLGAARVALIRNMPPLVVGVVIIGFGTSCPELLVSAIAAAGDKPEIAVGNIVGSNVANLSLLLGVGAIIIPLSVSSSTVRREAPITLAAMIAFALAVQGGGVSAVEGAALLVALGLAVWKVTSASHGDPLGTETAELADVAHHRLSREALRTLLGLVGTIAGAQLLLWGAIDVADRAGIGEGFVGFTLVAIGTSLPELVTVTGTPGAGKSQWTLAWLCNLARLHNVKSAIVQLEDDPSRNRHDLMQYAATWQHEHGEQPEDCVDQRFVTKVPPEPHGDEEVVTLDWLREAVEDAALRHDCKVVLIDPWNEIEHAFERGFSETQYTNDALRKIKSLARKYQIAIVIVTHPSKGIVGKGIEDITLYDVSGSQAWNNKSDHGIIVHRDEGDTESKIKVAKCKSYKTMGYPGIVTMQFHPPTASFKFVRSGV